MADITLESENGYGWAIVPQGQQPTKAHVTTLRTTRGFGWSAERGNGSGPLPDVPPELIVGNIVLVGSSIDHVPGEWEPGVDVEGEYVRRANGTGPWLATGITSGPYIAQTVADVVTWREIGTDANGRRTTVYAQPFATVYAEPVVVTPATLTGALLPGELYTSTAATFTGFPEPEVSHGVQRQLGTTGAIETVGASGMRTVGYRYRPATRGYSLAGEVWSYGDGWSAVVAPPAVAPTVSLARTPSGAITQGDTVTLDAARTGTPDPTPVWEITRNGAPFTTAGGTWSRYIDDIEDGNYVVTVTVTNSAGTATDTLSFTAAAASTDVPPYVISNPNLPALTEGVEVTAPAATFGGTPVPTASQKIQRRLPPATTWEDTGTGLTFVPAANYVYSRLATVSNGVGPALVVRSAESGAVVQVDWAYTESDGVVTIVKSPGQPPTPSVTDITYNSARIVPGSVASPAVQRFLIMPDADFNEANPSLSSSGNIIKTEGINFQSPAPNVKLATFRRSANFDFTTLPAPALPKFADTFAGDGDLTGHTPEAGGVWLPPPSGANTLVKFLGRLRGTTVQATPAFNFSSSELAASGGYVEAVAVCLARKPGGIGAMPLAIDLNNHLIMNFVYHSTDPNLDGVYVSERRGGTSYPLLSYLIPNMSDGDQQHRARVEVSRATKNVRLIVDEVDRGGATYSGTYPAGTKMGARWAASTSTYPTPNGAVQLAEMLAGDL